MTEDIKGYFCTSLAGHDKGRIYYIVSEDDAHVYLADGRYRMLGGEKKKKKKHVRLIKKRMVLVNDREIRSAVKEFEDVQG